MAKAMISFFSEMNNQEGESMKEVIRKDVLALGADVCGFAAVERFEQAPIGFHPRDLYDSCESVISFGIALPKGLLDVKPDLLYGYFNYQVCPKIDEIALKTAKIIEDTYGGRAVPVPSDGPYEYWDSEKKEGRGLLSLKHTAVNAGLGTMGKNTLLLTKKYGNRLILGAVLTNLTLQSDSMAEPLCTDGCNLCLKSCPVGALDGKTAVQKLCRESAYGKNERGYDTVVCNRCRSVCPRRYGI